MITPGISPFSANSLNLFRAIPNLRKVPRGRPVIAQRLRCLTGDELRGYDELPTVMSGLGVAIVSTSKGVITDRKALITVGNSSKPR